jgi:phosphate starvation-inducible PhoH-like protein
VCAGEGLSLPNQTVAIAREFQLEPADNTRLASLSGPLDANLRLLESRLDVQIRRRGHGFRVQGLRAEAAERALRELHHQASGGALSPEQVHLCIVELASPAAAEPGGGPAGARDPQLVRTPRLVIRARGAHQHAYLASIRESDLTFGIGPAGTGKTYLAVACAVESLTSERVRRLVLVRPAVEAGERLGFLPGDLAQKVDPAWPSGALRVLSFHHVGFLTNYSIIEPPLAHARPLISDSFIILDEAQNFTVRQ